MFFVGFIFFMCPVSDSRKGSLFRFTFSTFALLSTYFKDMTGKSTQLGSFGFLYQGGMFLALGRNSNSFPVLLTGEKSGSLFKLDTTLQGVEEAG